MQKKLLTLSCASLALLLSLSPRFFIKSKADSNTVEYKNNAYQMHQVQGKTQNLFLAESIYNITPSRVQLKNSIRLKKDSDDDIIKIYLKFNDIIRPFLNGGHLSLYIVDDNGRTVEYIDYTFEDEGHYDDGLENCYFEFDFVDDAMVISFSTLDLPSYFTICGDEYNSKGQGFYIDLNEGKYTNTIRSFSLEINSKIESDTPVDKVSTPSYGIMPNSKGVYYDGCKYNLDIDYDNRLNVNEILSSIVAYDYADNKELNKTVSNDTYSQALLENKLGTYSFKVSASDSSSNTSSIDIITHIKDLTPPSIIGDDYLSISYTQLRENNTILASSYYQGIDNYDKNSCLLTNEIALTPFEETALTLHAEDSSGNHSTKNVRIFVYDDVAPTITGSDYLEFYQFEIKDDDYLINNYFSFNDEGSKIKEVGIKKSLGKCDYGKAGTYPITLYCKDNFDNETTYKTTIKIKDGVGPVFFINEVSLSLTTASLKTANEIIAQSQLHNSIPNVSYVESKFIDSTYVENYNKEGSYKTKIVCYKKDGTRDYYLFNISVQKEIEKNLFKRFFNSIRDFFNRCNSFFRYIWETITRN